MQYGRRLSFEETRGTKTYYLPLTPPHNTKRGEEGDGHFREATLMVRRLPDGTYHAGLAVCSLEEPFVRLEGRYRAFEKLQHAPYIGIVAANSIALARRLEGCFDQIVKHHPLTVGVATLIDSDTVCNKLDEVFDALDKNRARKGKSISV